MTKFTFLFLIPIGLSLCAKAQPQTDSLIGKWKYYDIYDKRGIDSPTLKIAKEYFGNMTLYFKPNTHYKAFVMNNNDEGTWNFNTATRKIRLTSNKGHSNETEIIDLKSDQL